MNNTSTAIQPDAETSNEVAPTGQLTLRDGCTAVLRPWAPRDDDSRQVGFEVTVIVARHEMVIAGARYTIAADGHCAEFAVAVMQGWQSQGLGCMLIEALCRAARRDSVRRLVTEFPSADLRMASLMERCGFMLVACEHDQRRKRAERGIPAHHGVMSSPAPTGWLRPNRELQTPQEL